MKYSESVFPFKASLEQCVDVFEEDSGPYLVVWWDRAGGHRLAWRQAL